MNRKKIHAYGTPERVTRVFQLSFFYVTLYTRVMQTYAMVVRPDENSNQVASRIKDVLSNHGYTEDNRNGETVFVIGGDGTFIYAVHQYMGRLDKVKFYGIHTGTLGFYTDFTENEVEEFLEAFLTGKCHDIEYPLLSATIDGKKYYGLNEIRVENAARTQVMEIFVNDKKLEDFRGTGICVCTQLGSTAYNRSLGGAVIQEGLPFIEMTEISGIHHIKYRSLGAPIILRQDTCLTFKSDSFQGALLGVDSDVYPLDDCTSICIHTSVSKKVHMLRGRQVSYFDRLKSLF